MYNQIATISLFVSDPNSPFDHIRVCKVNIGTFWNMTLLGAATVMRGIILTKFMMSLRDENYRVLTGAAIDRGISVQELLRAVIIPDWVKETPRGIVADNWPTIRPHR